MILWLRLLGGNKKLVYDGEFRKILGIFFCGNVLQYVYKNWREVFKRCVATLLLWGGERLSLIGKILIC